MSSPTNDVPIDLKLDDPAPVESLLRLTLDNTHTIIEHESFPGGSMVLNTEDVARRYFRTTKKDSGLLPPVVRWISPDFKTYLVERPPMQVSINYKNNTKNAKIENDKVTVTNYKLYLPWTVYLINFSDSEMSQMGRMYAFARNSSIWSEDDILYHLPCPNVFNDGGICTGGLLEDAIGQLENTEEIDTSTILNCLVNTFWASSFNLDVMEFATSSAIPEYFIDRGVIQKIDGAHSFVKTGTGFLEEWSKCSQEDVLEIAYRETKWYTGVEGELILTVRKIMEDFTKKDHSDYGRAFLGFVRQLSQD